MQPALKHFPAEQVGSWHSPGATAEPVAPQAITTGAPWPRSPLVPPQWPVATLCEQGVETGAQPGAGTGVQTASCQALTHCQKPHCLVE